MIITQNDIDKIEYEKTIPKNPAICTTTNYICSTCGRTLIMNIKSLDKENTKCECGQIIKWR